MQFNLNSHSTIPLRNLWDLNGRNLQAVLHFLPEKILFLLETIVQCFLAGLQCCFNRLLLDQNLRQFHSFRQRFRLIFALK